MGEVWARLGEATHNDEPLITFVQQLLTLDPEPRARFGELVRTHPYLQPAPQPVSVGQAPSLAAIPTPLAAGAVAPTPLQVASRPNVDKVVVEQLRPLPGLPSVLWHPASVAVCQMSSGSVYRYSSLLAMSACAPRSSADLLPDTSIMQFFQDAISCRVITAALTVSILA